jgi:hypothetical protein
MNGPRSLSIRIDMTLSFIVLVDFQGVVSMKVRKSLRHVSHSRNLVVSENWGEGSVNKIGIHVS